MGEKVGVMSLVEHRRRKLWSVDALARAAKVSPQTVVNIEKEHRIPRLATMAKIANALDVDPLEIAEFHREITAPPPSKEAP